MRQLNRMQWFCSNKRTKIGLKKYVLGPAFFGRFLILRGAGIYVISVTSLSVFWGMNPGSACSQSPCEGSKVPAERANSGRLAHKYYI